MLQGVLPIYLIDGQEPLLCAKRWAILAHSPNISRYKDFLKSMLAGVLHFMPPFELEELMQLRPWGLPGQKELTEHEVRFAPHQYRVGAVQMPAAVSPML